MGKETRHESDWYLFCFWEREWQGDYLAYVRKVKRLGFDILELGAGALPDMTAAERRPWPTPPGRRAVRLTYCIGLPPQYERVQPG